MYRLWDFSLESVEPHFQLLENVKHEISLYHLSKILTPGS
jgi:hypothetical protein